jgi:hypothetical protein
MSYLLSLLLTISYVIWASDWGNCTSPRHPRGIRVPHWLRFGSFYTLFIFIKLHLISLYSLFGPTLPHLLHYGGFTTWIPIYIWTVLSWWTDKMPFNLSLAHNLALIKCTFHPFNRLAYLTCHWYWPLLPPFDISSCPPRNTLIFTFQPYPHSSSSQSSSLFSLSS